MAETILQINKLTKNYGALQATRDLSFAVCTGHLHAIIGPNGAGKTTLVNQLTGDIFSDSGTIIYKQQDLPFRCGNFL